MISSLEEIETSFISLSLSFEEKQKLIKMIFSNKYEFKFIVLDIEEAIKIITKYKNLGFKIFMEDENYEQVAYVLYK